MTLHFEYLFAIALVPLVLGSIYYNPKVLGNAWMSAAGISMPESRPSPMEMLKIYLPVYLFSLIFCGMVLLSTCIHQMGAYGMIGGDEANALPSFAGFMADYGLAFRTFKHGALHGSFLGLAATLFLVGTSALFEQKTWKYIFIHLGFNVLCSAIMGGLICQFV